MGSTFRVNTGVAGGSNQTVTTTYTGAAEGMGEEVENAVLGDYTFNMTDVDDHIQQDGSYVTASGTITGTVGTVPTGTGMFEYRALDGETMTVMAYIQEKNPDPTSISVPNIVSYRDAEYTVIVIEAGVFKDDTKERVTIPNISIIDESLFDGCSSLRGLYYK